MHETGKKISTCHEQMEFTVRTWVHVCVHVCVRACVCVLIYNDFVCVLKVYLFHENLFSFRNTR